VPFWQKGDKFLPTTFNARAEGIEKAPLWRHSLEAKRCLVPADSFSEWKHIAKKGNPKYEFSVNGGRPFAFAGLWSGWTNPADQTDRVWGDWTESRAIFRRMAWAGVRAKDFPPLFSGGSAAKNELCRFAN